MYNTLCTAARMGLTCPGNRLFVPQERGGVKRLRLGVPIIRAESCYSQATAPYDLDEIRLKNFYEVVFNENINGKKNRFPYRRLQDRR